MQDYLKHYEVNILVLSPMHIGSGEKIGKKEYIYMPGKHQVIVPDLIKMYTDIQKKGLGREYEKYMMYTTQKGPSLSQWLKQQGFNSGDFVKWKQYEMDAGEAFVTQTAKPKEIDAFIKDAYGQPYVPGSSIKGMIRTALIAWKLYNQPERYATVQQEIWKRSVVQENRKNCLARETKQLEQAVLYTLSRDEKKSGNAVNDCLSGMHVGDSDPIGIEKLTLGQKIDYTLDGTEKPLLLLRECLMPGTEIRCELSIDTTLCPYTVEDIMEALNYLQSVAYTSFYSRFKRGSSEKDIIWLGGGCGFLSKTIIYPMFGERGVKVTDNIFRNTLGRQYEQHKHAKDLRLKLAPHVCKCTRFRGRLYDMGMGRISFREA